MPDLQTKESFFIWKRVVATRTFEWHEITEMKSYIIEILNEDDASKK